MSIDKVAGIINYNKAGTINNRRDICMEARK